MQQLTIKQENCTDYSDRLDRVGEITIDKVRNLIENHTKEFNKDLFRFTKLYQSTTMENLIKNYKEWQKHKEIFLNSLNNLFNNSKQGKK